MILFLGLHVKGFRWMIVFSWLGWLTLKVLNGQILCIDLMPLGHALCPRLGQLECQNYSLLEADSKHARKHQYLT